MEKILTADFSNGASQIRLRGIWQHDYGAKLKVKGIDYSNLIRVDFAGANDPKAYPVVAVQETDGTFTAKIPKGVADQAYDINAYIYVSGNESGYTVKQVVMPVQERVEADPASGGGTDTDPYADVLEKMKEYKTAAEGSERNATSSAEKAAEAAKSAGESEKKTASAAKSAEESATSAKKSESVVEKAAAAEEERKKAEIGRIEKEKNRDTAEKEREQAEAEREKQAKEALNKANEAVKIANQVNGASYISDKDKKVKYAYTIYIERGIPHLALTPINE